MAGAFGGPQRALESGKLAGERQTAMDNMIKTLEDNYDEQVHIGDKDVGLTRDIFRTYAYDNKGNKYGYYGSLSTGTKDAIDNTQKKYEEYKDKQGAYDRMRTTGMTAAGKTATEADLAEAWDDVESARTVYQALKSSTDKKIDTDFNTKMVKDFKEHKELFKDKGILGVERSVETYDHVAAKGYRTDDFIAGRSNTKKASDHYETQQDRFNNSAAAAAYNRSNTRGGK